MKSAYRKNRNTGRHIYRAAVRRRQLMFRRLIITAMISVFIVMAFFSARAVTSGAATTVTKEKHYESVLIHNGDTLTTLSSKYRDDEEQTFDDFLSDVCSVNDLSDVDTIHEGCYILIPVYTEAQ